MVRTRRSKFAVLALSSMAAMLALVPAAGAMGEPDSGAFNAFKLKGSNGYRVVVWAFSQKRYRHGEVAIIVDREHQAVLYSAPAVVTDTRIDADLGPLGEIDVTFQPSGEQGVDHPVCDRSQRTTYDKGSYVGTIDFRGEEGYTRARAVSAPYTLHPFIDFICAGSGSGEAVGRGLPGVRLLARAKTGQGEVLELQANQNRPGARVKINVSTKERRDRVRIIRETSFTHPATSLDFAPDLGAAVFAPPAPFSGSALYLRDAEPANRWTGSLAIDLPGRSDLSLAGSRFDTKLAHAQLTEFPVHGDRTDRPNLSGWPSTKLSPTVFATSSPLAPR